MTGAARNGRKRITLQRGDTSRNALNEPIVTWSTLGSVWAGVADVSSKEMLAAQEVAATLSTRFTVRHSELTADLSPTDRLTYAGRVYNITAVRVKLDNRWLEIDTAVRYDVAMVETSP